MQPAPTPQPHGFWSEVKRRFHAPTPQFWQKARNRALLASGILTPLTVLNLREPLGSIISYAIAGLAGIATAAQFTCDSAPPTVPTPTPAAPAESC